jgi:hypothetical protein
MVHHKNKSHGKKCMRKIVPLKPFRRFFSLKSSTINRHVLCSYFSSEFRNCCRAFKKFPSPDSYTCVHISPRLGSPPL